jgi:protein O-mannosyl-transferase
MFDLLQRHRTCWQSSLLVILGVVVFWPSVSFDFVNWDDPAYLQHNDLIKGWSWQNLKGIATEVVTRNYAPLTIFSFLIEHTLWGLNPDGYHITNIVLHAINGVLVFLLIRRLSGSTFVGWITAALFLVHPVQIESVVWISSRKGLLCSMFMLGAMLARMKPQPVSRDEGRYVLLLALALFSKAHAVVLPPIMLLYDVLVRRKSIAEALPRQVIPGFMSLLLLMLTTGAQNSVLGGVRGHMSLGLLQIMAVDVTILWQYMAMLFCPTDLCVMYDPPTSGIWPQVMIGIVGWAIVGLGLWKIRRTHPLWILGACSFLLLLFPMLNFFRITTLMNDRYLYLPCIIIFAMVASVVERVLQVADSPLRHVLDLISNSTKGALAFVVIAGFAFLTQQHQPVWAGPESLWTHALSRYPDMPLLRIQYAVTLYDQGRVAEALDVMNRALKECRPDELDLERMQQFAVDWERELTTKQATADNSLKHGA